MLWEICTVDWKEMMGSCDMLLNLSCMQCYSGLRSNPRVEDTWYGVRVLYTGV